MVGWMPYRSQRSETGVCSRRWSRRMAAFSWTGSRFRVFLGMGGPPLEVVAYSSRRLVPFQLKQNTFASKAPLGSSRVALRLLRLSWLSRLLPTLLPEVGHLID